MNAKPTYPQPSSFSIVVAAGLATIVAIGLPAAISFLFQRAGAPLQHVVAAERACIQRVYVSEREACMREWLAVARASNVANNQPGFSETTTR